jgi:hypothetical protein
MVKCEGKEGENKEVAYPYLSVVPDGLATSLSSLDAPSQAEFAVFSDDLAPSWIPKETERIVGMTKHHNGGNTNSITWVSDGTKKDNILMDSF